jgi:golgin subfamily B member 1
MLLGSFALTGRSGPELAFMAGRHLAYYREEHFLKVLVPNMRSLEEVFLAALSIGNPGMPLNSKVKEMVEPIAKAIEPVLEPAQVDKLRGQFLRFVQDGGRANLLKWSTAIDHTCNRAGFLLSGDLRAAHTVLEIEDPRNLREHMDDLLSFVVSESLSSLQKQIGL